MPVGTGRRKTMHRKVLVIGGTRGIGEGIAKRFKTDGDRVTAWGRKDFDVRDISVIKGKEINDTPIDVLIYCSGIMKLRGFEKITYEHYQEVMNTNLTGAVFTIQKYLPYLNIGAHVMTICSVSANFPSINEIDYSISKVGLKMLTRCLSKEYGDKYFFNSISPGFCETTLVDSQEAIPQELIDYIPAKRACYPDEIAELVYFISNTTYFNGHDFIYDGGLLAKYDGPTFPYEEIY
jgi:3-oxoacyl-[acyl-carrier protein] reductase